MNGGPADAAQLDVEKADVEGGVVDDDLGAAHVLDQLVDDVREERLVGEEFLATGRAPCSASSWLRRSGLT